MNKWKVFSIVVVLIIAFFLIFSTYKTDNSVKLPSGEKIGTITNIQYKYYAKALWGNDIDEGFVQQNDPNADYTIVTVNKNIKLNFDTKLTEYKIGDTVIMTQNNQGNINLQLYNLPLVKRIYSAKFWIEIFISLIILIGLITLLIHITKRENLEKLQREEEAREEEQIRLEKERAKAEEEKRQDEIRVQQEEMKRAEEEKRQDEMRRVEEERLRQLREAIEKKIENLKKEYSERKTIEYKKLFNNPEHKPPCARCNKELVFTNLYCEFLCGEINWNIYNEDGTNKYTEGAINVIMNSTIMITDHIPSVEYYTSPYHDIGTCKFFCNTCGAHRRIEIEQEKLIKEQQNTERAKQYAFNAQKRAADAQERATHDALEVQKRAAEVQERAAHDALEAQKRAADAQERAAERDYEDKHRNDN
jgi:hypothetical protein